MQNFTTDLTGSLHSARNAYAEGPAVFPTLGSANPSGVYGARPPVSPCRFNTYQSSRLGEQRASGASRELESAI